MKLPTVLLTALLACTSLEVAPTFADDPVQQALPHHAHLLRVVGIPGLAHRYALSYRDGQNFLAVAYAVPGKSRLLWSKRVPDPPSKLLSPGPKGLFAAIVNMDSGSTVRCYAYKLDGKSISSAIEGQSSGFVSADEGVSLHQLTVTVRNRDRAHLGSVKYRLVTSYRWSMAMYRVIGTVRVPDYPSKKLPTPSGTIYTSSGDRILIRLEVAATEAQRDTGLMYRKALDPDSGMIFVWDHPPVQDSFWMANTYVPLSIAFLGADGRIQEILDMAPLTTDLHTPDLPYTYAVEVNQGFFAASGIKVGDHVDLRLS